MARWLCECDVTSTLDRRVCWACGHPRPSAKDEEIATLRTALTAATERAERAEADITAARALLRECLEAVRMVENYHRPYHWDDELRARIEAHLGRSE